MELAADSLSEIVRYKLLIGAIVPRPIAFVSTISVDGRSNLAPFSFFNGIGSNPMTLLFCPASRADGGEKDTLRNCKPVAEGGTGEFVVNVAVELYAREVAAAGEDLPFGESEFAMTGLAAAPSVRVKSPRLAASPVCFECETLSVVRTNPGAPGAGNVVIGRVVHIYVQDSLISDRYHIDPEKLCAVGRMGGDEYCFTRDRYALPRGRAVLQAAAPRYGEGR